MSRADDHQARGQFRFRFGTAEFDQARFELILDGRAVQAERRPLELLEVLLIHVGEVVTHEELHGAVWRDRVTERDVLKQAMAKLRVALGPEHAGRITTVPRVGYRFDGPVERIATGRGMVSALSLEPGMAVPGRDPFVLEEQLSGTGLNEVWLARAAETAQSRVFKFCVDGDGLAALKREVTLSRYLLQELGPRADIAPILEWNFSDPPFYVERADHGTDLLRWSQCDDRLSGLSRAERLDLFLQITEAVAAAHKVGVMHKDLKPANVLIRDCADGRQVCLTDFGSGRLMEPRQLEALGITALGTTLVSSDSSDADGGTPLYLAPEVVAGQPATLQSDIYALGVLLYQLLAGDMRRPFAPGWERDVDDELLVADVAAATAREPTDRLRSAGELADGVRRLEVRRQRVAEQRQMEARARRDREALSRARVRRPWLVAAAVSLIGGSLVSLGLYYEARKARDEAQLARSEAELQLARLRTVNEFWNREIIGSANPFAAKGNPDTTIREVLDRAAQRIGEVFSDDPEVSASLYASLSIAYVGLSQLDPGIAAGDEAIRLYTTLEGPSGFRGLAVRMAQVRALVQASRLDEAEAHLQSAIEAAGDPAQYPEEFRYSLLFNQGTLNMIRQRWSEAAAFFEQAIEAERGIEVTPAQWYKLRTEVVDVYWRLGRQDDAEAWLREMLDPNRDVSEVSLSRLAVTRMQMAQLMMGRGQYTDAEALLLQAERDLSTTGAVYMTMTAKGTLADLYYRMRRLDDALVYSAAALDGMEDALGADHNVTNIVRASRAAILLAASRNDEAARAFDTARGNLIAQVGEGSPIIQGIDYHRALIHSQRQEYARARALLATLDAEKLYEAAPEPTWADRLSALAVFLDARTGGSEARPDRLHGSLAKLRDCGCDPALEELLESALNDA